MSDDKMRAEFEAWAAREEYNLIRYSWPDEKHSKGYGSDYADKQTTAAEHGYQAGYQAGQTAEREAIFIEWENGEIMAAEVERLRAELELSKGNVESLKKALFDLQEAAISLGDQIDNAKAELAAAKAASVVPVKWKSVERFFQSGADLGNQWGIEFWFDTKEQRDKFGKWIKERGEG